MTQAEGAFKVHKNQSWQLSKPLIDCALCHAKCRTEPALYHQEEWGEAGKTGVRESGSRRKQELKSDTSQFLCHQTVNLGATWFKPQVGDFMQLNLEQDGQCSKKGKANRQGEGWSASLQRLLNRNDGEEQIYFSTRSTEGLHWFINSLDNEQSGRKKEI